MLAHAASGLLSEGLAPQSAGPAARPTRGRLPPARPYTGPSPHIIPPPPHSWHDLVLGAREDVCRLMTWEAGKPLAESRAEFDSGWVRGCSEGMQGGMQCCDACVLVVSQQWPLPITGGRGGDACTGCPTLNKARAVVRPSAQTWPTGAPPPLPLSFTPPLRAAPPPSSGLRRRPSAPAATCWSRPTATAASWCDARPPARLIAGLRRRGGARLPARLLEEAWRCPPACLPA